MKCNHQMEIRISRLCFILNKQGCRRGISTSFVCYKDYYSVLGVDRNATQKEIRNKFLELCKLYHPDKVLSGNEKEKESQKVKFQEVSEAYENLSKMDTRSAHDTDLKYGYTTSTKGPYRGGNYTGYTQYNRRRYEGKPPPGSENTEGWHSSWNESDRYKDDDYWKKYSEDEFYRQQYAKNRKRWDDDMNRWAAYRDYYRKSPFSSQSSPHENYRPKGAPFTNGQIVRMCISLLILSFMFHMFESMAFQRETDNYYDRSRRYYQEYDIIRGKQNKVNADDLNERTLFIERLKNSAVKSD